MKVTYRCKACGSSAVVADAAAFWDDEAQEWRFSHVWDNDPSCNDCGSTDIEEKPLGEEVKP